MSVEHAGRYTLSLRRVIRRGVQGLLLCAVLALGLAGCVGDITAESAINDFCDAKSSAEQTKQTCINELETYFGDCREVERARGIDLQDTNCVDKARDSWDH